jgi:hypothetical protein
MTTQRLRIARINKPLDRNKVLDSEKVDIAIMQDSDMEGSGGALGGVTLWVTYRSNILDKFSHDYFSRSSVFVSQDFTTITSAWLNSYKEVVNYLKELFPDFDIVVV